jgi:hypothetical protein
MKTYVTNLALAIIGLLATMSVLGCAKEEGTITKEDEKKFQGSPTRPAGLGAAIAAEMSKGKSGGPAGPNPKK